MNYERFRNQKAWNLTQLLDKTPSSDPKAYKAVMSQLQTVFLQNLPRFRSGTTGCGPCSTRSTGRTTRRQQAYTPTAWNNYWQMTSIDMLTHLKPAK